MAGADRLTITTRPVPSVVDGRACRTRAALFVEVARVLDFPDHFGHNWSALSDCLRDVGAGEVFIAHAEELLADEPADFAVLLRILARAAADGRTVTLCTDAEHESALRERVQGGFRSDGQDPVA